MITLHLPDHTPLAAIDQLARTVGGRTTAHPSGHLTIQQRDQQMPAATQPLPGQPPGIIVTPDQR